MANDWLNINPTYSKSPEVPWEYLFIEVIAILIAVFIALGVFFVCVRFFIKKPKHSSFYHHQNIAKSNSRLLHFSFWIICIVFVLTFLYISTLIFYTFFKADVLSPFAFLDFYTFLHLHSFEFTFASCLTLLLLLVLAERYIDFTRKKNDYEFFKKQFRIIEYNNPQINTIIEEMSIASNTQKPLVFFLKDNSINAFVTILKKDDQEQYALVLTRGLILNLNRDEIQAVVAHEFSHIVNQDIQSGLQLAGYAFCLDFFTKLGLSFFRILPKSRGSSSKKNNGANFVLIFGITVVFIGCVGSLGARLLQSLFSRQREFLADSSATQYTRNPEALLNALIKIDKFEKSNTQPQFHNKNALSTYSHMCFSSIFKGIFSTHPPIEQRIDRLKEILKLR